MHEFLNPADGIDILKDDESIRLLPTEVKNVQYFKRSNDEEKNTTLGTVSCCYHKFEREDLENISREAIVCPISICKKSMTMHTMLGHCLRDHSIDMNLKHVVITAGAPAAFYFAPGNIGPGEQTCVGVASYAGIDLHNPKLTPGMRLISLKNAQLPKLHVNLETHLLIMVMVYKATVQNIFLNRKPGRDALFIWLASPATLKPLKCKITAIGQGADTIEQGILTTVRTLDNNQTLAKFFPDDGQCLFLPAADVDLLKHDLEETIKLEIELYDFGDNS